MNYNNKGSALLFVLLIMSSLIVLCMTSWRTTAHMFDVVYQRGVYYKKIYLARALFDYVCVYCKEQFDILGDNKKQTNIVVATWPPNEYEYSGLVKIMLKNKATVQISTTLLSKDGERQVTITGILCKMQNNQKDKFIIREHVYNNYV